MLVPLPSDCARLLGAQSEGKLWVHSKLNVFLRRKLHPCIRPNLSPKWTGQVGLEGNKTPGLVLACDALHATHSHAHIHIHTVSHKQTHTHISIESANSPLSEVSESLGGIGLYASDLRAN